MKVLELESQTNYERFGTRSAASLHKNLYFYFVTSRDWHYRTSFHDRGKWALLVYFFLGKFYSIRFTLNLRTCKNITSVTECEKTCWVLLKIINSWKNIFFAFQCAFKAFTLNFGWNQLFTCICLDKQNSSYFSIASYLLHLSPFPLHCKVLNIYLYGS